MSLILSDSDLQQKIDELVLNKQVVYIENSEKNTNVAKTIIATFFTTHSMYPFKISDIRKIFLLDKDDLIIYADISEIRRNKFVPMTVKFKFDGDVLALYLDLPYVYELKRPDYV